MTSLRFVNAFDLLGDDESEDVTVLYERMQIKGVNEEVAISETKSEKSEKAVVSQPETNKEGNGSDGHVNGTENGTVDADGWNTVSKKVYEKKVKRPYNQYGRNYNGGRRGYGNGQVYSDSANGDGSEQRKGNGHVNGNGSGNGEVKELGEACNGGNVVASDNASNGGDANVLTESDAGITVELSNGEEVKEETAEERKAREKEEELKKEREERRKKWEAEQAEEAKKRTLAQYYEEIRLEKAKLALNEKKAEAKRVIVADKDLESMTVVPRKQAVDEPLLIIRNKDTESTAVVAKKHANGASVVVNHHRGTSESSAGSEKKASKTVVQLKLFAPTSYRRSNNDGRGRGGGHRDQGARFSPSNSSSDAQPKNNLPDWFTETDDTTSDTPVDEETKTNSKYENSFPVLGSVPPKEEAPKRVIKADPKPVIEVTPKLIPKPIKDTAPVPVVKAVSEADLAPASKASPPLGPKRTGARQNRNGSRGNPPGSGANRRNGGLAKN